MAWVCSWCGLPDRDWLDSLSPLGTALKPAWEPIVLARKPLAKGLTVAANVLAHGTGGINVDGCRIEAIGGLTSGGNPEGHNNPCYMSKDDDPRRERAPEHALGRWPANLILSHTSECREVGVRRVKGTNPPSVNATCGKMGYHGADGEMVANHYADPDGRETVAAWDCARDPETGEYVCPVALLDQMSGITSETPRVLNRNGARQMDGWGLAAESKGIVHGDTGGASRFFLNVPPDDPATRFFYCSKSSRAERNRGLEGMPETDAYLTTGRGLSTVRSCPDHGKGQPSGSNTYACGCPVRYGAPDQRLPTANHHPTVKPLALMRWLVRLVAPPGGLVLDPFCGSGTTGVACALEGFGFLGIDEDAEDQGYLDIAARRIADAQGAVFADVEVVAAEQARKGDGAE